MKKLLLLVTLATAIFGQNTPKFPSTVATNQDLAIARNGSVSTLNGGINNSTTSVVVIDGTQFPVTSLITVDTEYMQVTAVIGNTLTVTRGFDSSTAASHSTGASVFGYFLAYHHNQVIAEVKAIETFLGASGNNLTIPFNQVITGISGGSLGVAGSIFPSGSGTVDANRFQGRSFTSTAPTDTQVICWDNPNSYWKPCNAGGGGSGGLTSLNGLTGATQTFATGTAGTDFGISSVGTTHTFNLPTASATNRGALSTADWSNFNGKQPALGFTAVPNTRNINTTSPITGGGNLTGDITIACPSCATGSGIQVNVTQAPYSATGNGTTDDTAAIQAAITAAGTNGFVYFPAGTYLVHTAGGGTITPIFDLTSNGLTLFGDGAGKTTIKRAVIATTPGNFQGATMQITGDYITIRDITFNENWNGQGGANGTIPSGKNPNWGAVRIGANGTTPTGNYAYVTRIEIKNSGWISMTLYNGIGAIIENNVITGLSLPNNYGIDGFWAGKYANQWVFKNNTVTDNCETAMIFSAQDALIADNFLARNHLNNGTCAADDPFPGGQLFLSNVQPNLAPQTTNPYYGRGIIIRGNHVVDGAGGASGIEIGITPGASTSLVDGPLVEGNYIGNNANWGIAIQGGNQVMIRNNKIERNGADGLFLDPTITYASIIGNDIGFNGFYGVRISSGAGNNFILADNVLHNNTSGDFLDLSSGTNKIIVNNLAPSPIDNQYTGGLTCTTSAASTCNLGTTAHEWNNGRINHLIGKDFSLTGVGGADTFSYLISATSWNSFLEFGNTGTTATFGGLSNGDAIIGHTGVATSFKSIRTGAVNNTLVLNAGKVLVNGAAASEGFTLDVSGTLGVYAGGSTNTTIEVKSDFNAATIRAYGTNGNNPVFQGQSADNSSLAPTNVKIDQPFAVLAGKGYDGSAFPSSSQAALIMGASQNQTSSAHGSYITLGTTPDGSLTRATRLTIDHNGNVIVGPSRTVGANGGFRYFGGAFQWSADLTTWNTFSTGTVCGSTQQIQFNSAGACGASANLKWDGNFFYANTLRLRGSDTFGIYEGNPATSLAMATHSGSLVFAPSTTVALTIATTGVATFASDINLGATIEARKDFGPATFRAFATSGNNPVFQGQAVDGSIASPTNSKINQPFVVVAGKGFDGSVYPSSSQASMAMKAAEDQTSIHHGSYIEFATTPNLSVTRAVRLTIDNLGTLIIGPSQAAFSNGGFRYNSGTGKLQYSHDLNTWTDLP